jgi:hypothetical protein
MVNPRDYPTVALNTTDDIWSFGAVVRPLTFHLPEQQTLSRTIPETELRRKGKEFILRIMKLD